MAKTNLFHVQDNILLANGFTKQVIDDKDGCNDVVNTLRLVLFTKRINDSLSIEINYGYSTDDEKNYKLQSTSVELRIDDEFSVIPISRLSDLLNLILILKGDE